MPGPKQCGNTEIKQTAHFNDGMESFSLEKWRASIAAIATTTVVSSTSTITVKKGTQTFAL